MQQLPDRQIVSIEQVKSDFIFCEVSWKKFENEFYIEKKEFKCCPNCGETEDVHNYADLFMCFKCKNKIKWNSHEFDLCIHNNYLCRIKKGSNRIGYFHRFLFANEIVIMAKKLSVAINQIHIHHINENTHDNRLKNLIPMSDNEHRFLHEQIGLDRLKDSARDTFLLNRELKQGYLEEGDYNDFEEWWENRE